MRLYLHNRLWKGTVFPSIVMFKKTQNYKYILVHLLIVQIRWKNNNKVVLRRKCIFTIPAALCVGIGNIYFHPKPILPGKLNWKEHTLPWFCYIKVYFQAEINFWGGIKYFGNYDWISFFIPPQCFRIQYLPPSDLQVVDYLTHTSVDVEYNHTAFDFMWSFT